MNRLFAACAIAALAACSPAEDNKQSTPAKPEAAASPAPIVLVKTEAPAGAYALDKSHASLIFRVNHIGFSNYTGRLRP